MEITLHLGAHRCASTTFQHYVHTQAETLSAQQIGYWGPRRTRNCLLNKLYHATPNNWKAAKDARKAKGRVRLQARQAALRGIRHLIVSDENMIGTARQCVRTRKLYPAVGERLSRLGDVFGQDISRVMLSIRSQELWWASTIAYTVGRGYPVPNALSLTEIASGARGWRDVITDIACALPEAEISVLPFEKHAGQPNHLLRVAADVTGTLEGAAPWLNRSPDRVKLRGLLKDQGVDPDLIPHGSGRWQPFDDMQSTRLRENYADDLHWLVAGADGLATLTEDPAPIETGITLHAGALIQGQGNDNGQQRMAHSG